jgi:cell wall-associated NlpC family hydrolase
MPLPFPFPFPVPVPARVTGRFLSRPFIGCLFALACASSAQAQAAPQGPVTGLDAPKPFAKWSNSVQSFRDSLVSMARAQVGIQYVHGGQSPEGGFDCSGLVHYVMEGLHVHVPRTAAQQARSGLAVARETDGLRPGDLLTFAKGKHGVSHIGIYVGNGRYVHASSVAGRVIESDIERPRSPLIKSWRGVRRVLAADVDSTAGIVTKGDS